MCIGSNVFSLRKIKKKKNDEQLRKCIQSLLVSEIVLLFFTCFTYLFSFFFANLVNFESHLIFYFIKKTWLFKSFIHFLCVYLQGIVKIKIDLRTKDIVNKEEASNDVEDIGKLAKVLLRNVRVVK
jgi:predicted transport protein